MLSDVESAYIERDQDNSQVHNNWQKSRQVTVMESPCSSESLCKLQLLELQAVRVAHTLRRHQTVWVSTARLELVGSMEGGSESL